MKCRVSAAILTLSLVNAATIKNYETDPPVVPSEDEDLVLEQVWQFDALNLAEVVTHLQWVPNSDQVITGHKHGMLRLYASIDSDVEDYVELLDIRTDVDSEGDHGLLSFHFHPEFANGVEKIFVMYTGNPKDVTLLPNNDVVAPLRDVGWGLSPTGGYEWPLDLCTFLGENNEDGKICEKVYYIERFAVDLNADEPTMTKEITLFDGVCGSSSTHGPGTLLEVDGALLFTMGDGSQYDLFDYGFEDLDACYVPGGGADQGVFRAQRDDFPNGKVLRISAELLDSEVALTLDDLTIVSKGLRQPYRMYYHETADKLYVGDVGYGDWGTSERIFIAEDVSLFDPTTSISFNWGWPCLEGMYDTAADAFTQNYNPFNAPSEQERALYLEDNDLTTCVGVVDAVEAYVAGTEAPDTADAGWYPPIFEYRNDLLDPDYPTICGTANAAITSVFVYEGDALPEIYQGKLMFADHVKTCLWYFDNDADGNPDMTVSPHVLISNMDIIDMQTGPDGYLYLVDYVNARVSRMYEYGKGPLTGTDTPPPTVSPTAAPFAIPGDILNAQNCFDAKAMPELVWTRNEDGSYTGDLILGVVTMTTDLGTTRTRAFNGLIPGPLIRMKACGTYNLNVYNDMAGWPTGFDGDGSVNGLKDPTVTNLHLHGLHISGEAPGDDVFIIIDAGGFNQYTYIIPCDHAGGTHLYHPHHHGSVALQTDAGAAGMLIIESSARESSGMPMDIQTMPEQFIFIQEFDPENSSRFATESGDRIYETDIADSFVLVNGCDEIEITVEAGRWTRLRILNVAQEFNTLLSLGLTKGDLECEIGLLAKDGIWLAEVPRAITVNDMFLAISSRLDIAIRCAEAESEHTLTYIHLGDPSVETAVPIGTIVVVESFREASPDLTPWVPCRPAYLIDIETLPAASFMTPVTLEVRDGLNGLLFTGEDEYFEEMDIGIAQQLIISGSDLHPFHIHINHMQFGSTLDDTNQWPEIATWNVAGDWVDTLASPGATSVYVLPERYIGHMVMHCHIAEHGDNGILGIIYINGEGDAGDGSPEITDYGTCAEEIPLSTPYSGVALAVPGVIEAEEFDSGGEGIAYHNINIDRNIGSSLRADEAVEIDTLELVSWVGFIRDGEWLRYSVEVAEEAYYSVDMTVATEETPMGMQWSLWLDAVDGCPASGTGDGELLRVNDQTYAGTGSYTTFEPYTAQDFALIAAGEHTLTLCFEGADAGINFDSLTFTMCGATLDECARRRKLVNKRTSFLISPQDGAWIP